MKGGEYLKRGMLAQTDDKFSIRYFQPVSANGFEYIFCNGRQYHPQYPNVAAMLTPTLSLNPRHSVTEVIAMTCPGIFGPR